jgi:hypothetical protein
MAKEAAPVALTGGAGFHFEDHVAARLLLDMLAGINSLGHAFGRIRRLDWQAREAGWHLDDFGVVCDAEGRERCAGLSCKSNRQVTSSGFPEHFVEAAWEHWYGAAGARRLREDQDGVVLVTGELAEGVREAWDATLREALETEPDRMLARLQPPAAGDASQSSAQQRDLFASLRCPATLRTYGPSDDLVTVRLLRHVRLLHFDFASPTSRAHGLAVSDCQRLLAAGDASQAAQLWDELVGYAATQRATGGSVDPPKLLSHVRGRFELAPHPEYGAGWLSRRLEGALTLGEWERRDRRGFAVTWVDFAARSQVVEQVRAHLRARSGPNVLHLAGLSGIGKTRTVLEACRDQPDLSEVLYIPRYADSGETLVRHFQRNEHQLALVVVDEVPLEDLRRIISQVEDFPNRLRFVTIGPARRGQRGRTPPNILILPEPDTREGVLVVVRSAGAGLSEQVLESVARFASHDLRLALMLVEATLRGDFRDLPIQDGDDVWRRVTSLFRSHLGDLGAFQTSYPYLTVAIDVGIQGELRRELEYIAEQFAVPAPRLDEAIGLATPCGLGVMTPRFFEPTPRALAGHLFRQRIWVTIRHRLTRFLSGMPDRLLRRFVDRCQECTGPEREEMEEALADFFHDELGEPDVTRLVDRDRSRLFKAWAELGPDHGLAWLGHAVERASDEQLAILDGAADGSGGWRGRRQIVWLCEALASFGDYFWRCEAVLFRLAQVETEPSIGNNSTEIWRGLFLPILAFTEVPFPDRADLLLRRLAGADERTLPLVFSAVVRALSVPEGRMAPPEVVAGRIVPEPWRPATYGDLHQLQRDLGRRALDAVSRLPAPVDRLGRQAVVANMPNFARFGLLGELRGLLDDADEEMRRAIRLQLRGLAELWEGALKKRPGGSPDTVMAELRHWEADLKPADLAGEVQELTSMDYWIATKRVGNPPERQKPFLYAQLAQDVLVHQGVMQRLADWFDSDKAKSAFHLGIALGEGDRDAALAAIVASWLEARRCRGVVAGYLRGLASRQGTLPAEWGERLDQAAKGDAEYAALVTIDADFSLSGFRRVISLVASGALPPGYLNAFTSPDWETPLGVGEKAEILQLLLHPQARDGEQGLAAYLLLSAAWTHYGSVPLPPELAGPTLQVLRASLNVRADPNAWSSLLESLARTHPEETADLATDALTSAGPLRTVVEDLTLKVLLDLAGRRPRLVMDAVGRRLLDPDRRPFFGLLCFHGLFEAIGLPEVQRWVTEHGAEVVRYIARHLDSPRLQSGAPFIPPVTEWVLSQFADDDRVFEEFCMGRHAFEVRVGPARDRRTELERAVGPFLRHTLPWVRRWAEYELKENEREAEMDDYTDDHQERM